MANDRIKLNAQAKTLGIDGYRTMGEAELRKLIAGAQGKTSAPTKGKASTAAVAPTKGKVSTNGTKGKTVATKTVAKATGKTAPAKGKASTTQKSAPKATAAKGTASRASTVKGKATTKPVVAKGKVTTNAKVLARGERSRATAKSTPKAEQPKRTSTRGKVEAPARVDLDLKAIDWKAESGVGKSGKRQIVLDSLRKTKSYAKTFDALKDQARKFYPGKDKNSAERMLVWLINRVAFDFAMSTEQHTPGQRAGYGTSDKPQDIARRERREAARLAAEKEARSAKRAAGKAATPKATAKPVARKAPVRKAATPAKGKTAAAVVKGKGK